MNTLEQIHSHRSIRKYQRKKIPHKVLERVLESALRASSSGNMQSFSVIVTKDAAVRRKLLPLHFNQQMVLSAPVFLTFCADFHRMRRWLKLSDAPDNFDNPMSFMIGAIDAILASQNAALAAEAEGLGICYLGTTLANCDKIARLLNCPKNVVPVVGFALGYPAERPAPRDRLPLKALVHQDIYRSLSDEEILVAYRERERAGMERYRSDPKLRKLIEGSGVSNLAQVYTRIKYTRQSHVQYSNTIEKCLRRQDFLNRAK